MIVRNLLFVLSFCALIAACAADDLSAYKRGLDGPERTPKGEPGRGDFPFRIGDLAPAHKPDPKTTEAGIWLQVEKLERQIKTAGRRVQIPELNAYVESVSCRVAGPYCGDIRVYLMRSPGFNAGMYPNGMMHVWSGLLLRVSNEAQLAAVIGHEAGHYLRRHTMKRIRDILDKSNSLVFVQLVLAGAGIPVAGDVAMLMTLASISAFSRDSEREADGYSILLMAQAGYDPEEAWKIWEAITKEKEADKEFEAPSFFFASHPVSEERMEALKKLAKLVKKPRAVDTGRERFLKAIRPIRRHLLRDELHQRKFGPFNVLLDRLVEDGDNVAELHFFRGEMHRIRNQEGDLAKALEFYEKARTSPGRAPAEMWRSVGLAHLKLGHRTKARKAFDDYLRNNPNATDGKMIRQVIKGLEK
ncbi:MAG: M48 family metalloprotease [Alphaproteobacteria bacterium]|nr:M48 family metalloprotease [Alphaproteobacteria bacterium]